MSANTRSSDPVGKGPLGAPDAGQWLVRRGAHSEPLEQRLRQVVSGYQRHGGGLGLAQGAMSVQAASPEAVAAAAAACERELKAMPVSWSTIRLGTPTGTETLPQVLPLLPAAAVLAAGREAGLLPPSRWASAMPAVHLTLWITVTLGAIALLAVGGAPGGAFSPGWRLVYITLAAAVLALVLRWVRGRRDAVQLRRCGEALRAAADPARRHAFAKALAAPALNALPKPVAIIVEDPSRLDPLSFEILRQMRQSSGATAIGIVHWLIFTLDGQDATAAAALAGGSGGAGSSVPSEPPCALTWRSGTGGQQP